MGKCHSKVEGNKPELSEVNNEQASNNINKLHSLDI